MSLQCLPSSPLPDLPLPSPLPPPQDPHRLHYEYYELKVFENIECEWPLFVIYLVINAVFDGNLEEVERYHSMLERLVIKGQNDLIYVPELYLVPEDKVRGRALTTYLLSPCHTLLPMLRPFSLHATPLLPMPHPFSLHATPHAHVMHYLLVMNDFL